VVEKLVGAYDRNFGARSVIHEVERIAVQLVADAQIQGVLKHGSVVTFITWREILANIPYIARTDGLHTSTSTTVAILTLLRPIQKVSHLMPLFSVSLKRSFVSLQNLYRCEEDVAMISFNEPPCRAKFLEQFPKYREREEYITDRRTKLNIHTPSG
jgi:hypothetical protein